MLKRSGNTEDPPEAEAEAEAGATIYIRVPAALKRRVDEAAKAEGVSGNLWAMRCIERCLGAEPDAAKTAPTTGASSAKRNKRKKS